MNPVMIFFLFWGQAAMLTNPKESLILTPYEKKTFVCFYSLSVFVSHPYFAWGKNPFFYQPVCSKN